MASNILLNESIKYNELSYTNEDLLKKVKELTDKNKELLEKVKELTDKQLTDTNQLFSVKKFKKKDNIVFDKCFDIIKSFLFSLLYYRSNKNVRYEYKEISKSNKLEDLLVNLALNLEENIYNKFKKIKENIIKLSHLIEKLPYPAQREIRDNFYEKLFKESETYFLHGNIVSALEAYIPSLFPIIADEDIHWSTKQDLIYECDGRNYVEEILRLICKYLPEKIDTEKMLFYLSVTNT